MACMKLISILQCLLALGVLLLLTLNPLPSMARGREISKHSDHRAARSLERINEEKMVMMRGVIGSKPPRCDEQRCKSCGHCVAVQVPIVPTKDFIQKQSYFYAPSRSNVVAYSRGDYISNYKPMSWKCKCGHSFFNP